MKVKCTEITYCRLGKRKWTHSNRSSWYSCNIDVSVHWLSDIALVAAGWTTLFGANSPFNPERTEALTWEVTLPEHW